MTEHDRIDHSECYANGVHSNTPDGRAGCRDAHRPASEASPTDHPDLDDPAVRDAILAAAADHIEEGHRVIGEFSPEDFPDPRASMTAAIELQGVQAGIWGAGVAPPMMADPLVEGCVTRADDTDDVYAFGAAITRGPSPFGIIVQLGRSGEAPLRTMWLDGSALLDMMISAGLAHITGDGLTWAGEGQDPASMTVPDTIPDDLEGDTPS